MDLLPFLSREQSQSRRYSISTPGLSQGREFVYGFILADSNHFYAKSLYGRVSSKNKTKGNFRSKGSEQIYILNVKK